MHTHASSGASDLSSELTTSSSGSGSDISVRTPSVLQYDGEEPKIAEDESYSNSYGMSFLSEETQVGNKPWDQQISCEPIQTWGSQTKEGPQPSLIGKHTHQGELGISKTSPSSNGFVGTPRSYATQRYCNDLPTADVTSLNSQTAAASLGQYSSASPRFINPCAYDQGEYSQNTVSQRPKARSAKSQRHRVPDASWSESLLQDFLVPDAQNRMLSGDSQHYSPNFGHQEGAFQYHPDTLHGNPMPFPSMMQMKPVPIIRQDMSWPQDFPNFHQTGYHHDDFPIGEHRFHCPCCTPNPACLQSQDIRYLNASSRTARPPNYSSDPSNSVALAERLRWRQNKVHQEPGSHFSQAGCPPDFQGGYPPPLPQHASVWPNARAATQSWQSPTSHTPSRYAAYGDTGGRNYR
ncbi:uncharacterized protein PAC_05410 [Phialocephala subalpina]|uniref:Uncharacterized protein n=1 Tax=Phialocephala subalpina TaxID=576137 RepID=A0A1L7WRX8_9HELO|nr:uncharacterized protein PAC_05410 [Phialocephala subalpina]